MRRLHGRPAETGVSHAASGGFQPVTQHRERQVPGFSARYNVQELVYFEPSGDIRLAVAREKQIKGWLRVKEIALIESLNPNWRDLSVEWRAAAPRVQH